MGVDVVDIVRRQAGALQRHRHAAVRAIAIFRRCGDVVSVTGKAVTDDFGINLCAARLGMFQLLQNDDAGTFAHDETVTVAIIGTGCLLRIVVMLGGKRLAGGKAGKRDAADRRSRHHLRP